MSITITTTFASFINKNNNKYNKNLINPSSKLIIKLIMLFPLLFVNVTESLCLTHLNNNINNLTQFHVESSSFKTVHFSSPPSKYINPKLNLNQQMTSTTITITSNKHNNNKIRIIPQKIMNENSTIHWLLDRLINVGFNTVGLYDMACRENAICRAAFSLITRMPDSVIQYGLDQIQNLPPAMLGEHDYTYAWVAGIGIGAGEEESKQTDPDLVSGIETCNALYPCEDQSGNGDDEITMTMLANQLSEEMLKNIELQEANKMKKKKPNKNTNNNTSLSLG